MNKSVILKMGTVNMQIESNNSPLIRLIKETHHDFVCSSRNQKPNFYMLIKYDEKATLVGYQNRFGYDKEKSMLFMNNTGAGIKVSYDLRKCLVTLRLNKSLNNNDDIRQGYKIIMSNLKLFFNYYLTTRRKGLMIHALGVKKGSQSIVFVGRSGAGKSFLAKYLKTQAGYEVMNDECILLQLTNDRICACSTIFAGKEEIKPRNITAPLKKVCFLKLSSRNKEIKKNKTYCFRNLLLNSFLAVQIQKNPMLIRDSGFRKGYLEMISDISSRVECYELERKPARIER